MLNIDYISLLNDDFVFNLTNNILKIQNSQEVVLYNSNYFILENNKYHNIENFIDVKKILNSIYLYQQTLNDPMIIFKLKKEGVLNEDNFDSTLYNTISVSILASENKKLKNVDQRIGKKRKLF